MKIQGPESKGRRSTRHGALAAPHGHTARRASASRPHVAQVPCLLLRGDPSTRDPRHAPRQPLEARGPSRPVPRRQRRAFATIARSRARRLALALQPRSRWVVHAAFAALPAARPATASSQPKPRGAGGDRRRGRRRRGAPRVKMKEGRRGGLHRDAKRARAATARWYDAVRAAKTAARSPRLASWSLDSWFTSCPLPCHCRRCTTYLPW